MLKQVELILMKFLSLHTQLSFPGNIAVILPEGKCIFHLLPLPTSTTSPSCNCRQSSYSLHCHMSWPRCCKLNLLAPFSNIAFTPNVCGDGFVSVVHFWHTHSLNILHTFPPSIPLAAKGGLNFL
jgi:hypothetical protein